MAICWGSDEERDHRHADVVSRFPNGLSWDQFVYCTLESARDDTDLIEPPSMADTFFDHHSRMMRLFLDGLVCSREGHNAPLRWRITAKGRAHLAELRTAHPDWISPTPSDRTGGKE